MFPDDIWYVLPNIHLMFFDRDEIHIQAFVDFINGTFIIFRSSSPQNIFYNRKLGMAWGEFAKLDKI